MKQKRVPGVQQVAGRGPTVESAGRVYRLTFNDQDAKGELEELMRAYVLGKADADARAAGGDRGERHYNRVMDRVDAGAYLTFGPGWRSLLVGDDGTPLLLLSLLRRHHPEMSLEDARELFAAETRQCKAALRLVCPDFFRAVLAQLTARAGAAVNPGRREGLDRALDELDARMGELWAEPEGGGAADGTGPPAPGLGPEATREPDTGCAS